MPRNLVVLCHGILGYGENDWKDKFNAYFKGAKEEILAIVPDYEVIVPTTLTAGSVEQRAEQLHVAIKEHIGDKIQSDTQVHLIGHSMGGLDCRRLVHMKPEFKVISVTTVGTPHHGSPVADFVKKALPLDPLRTLIESFIPELATGGLEDLQPMNAARFNTKYPNKSNIRYLSVAALYHPTKSLGVFSFPDLIMKHSPPNLPSILKDGLSHPQNLPEAGADITFLEEQRKKLYWRAYGPGDGVVAVESARWGEYLGTMDNVDHMGLVKWKITGIHFDSDNGIGFNAYKGNLYGQIIQVLIRLEEQPRVVRPCRDPKFLAWLGRRKTV